MGFLVSPGVQVNEVDLTNVVPAVATSIGAIAGAFQKGPVSSIVNISSEEELVEIFGLVTTKTPAAQITQNLWEGGLLLIIHLLWVTRGR